MGLFYGNSDGSLPVRNWLQGTLAAPTGAPGALLGVSTMVVRAAVFASPTNAGTISIGPTGSANYRILNPGDEYTLPSGPSCFDLSLWFAQASAAGCTLSFIYQAA